MLSSRLRRLQSTDFSWKSSLMFDAENLAFPAEMFIAIMEHDMDMKKISGDDQKIDHFVSHIATDFEDISKTSTWKKKVFTQRKTGETCQPPPLIPLDQQFTVPPVAEHVEVEADQPESVLSWSETKSDFLNVFGLKGEISLNQKLALLESVAKTDDETALTYQIRIQFIANAVIFSQLKPEFPCVEDATDEHVVLGKLLLILGTKHKNSDFLSSMEPESKTFADLVEAMVQESERAVVVKQEWATESEASDDDEDKPLVAPTLELGMEDDGFEGDKVKTEFEEDSFGIKEDPDYPYDWGPVEESAFDADDTEDKEWKYHCCNLAFSTKRDKLDHQRKAHLGRDRARKYPCKICGMVFETLRDHNVHQTESHAGGKMNVCQLCNTTFKDKVERKKHRESEHSGKRCKCYLCGKELGNYSSLESHLHLVHGPTSKVPPPPVRPEGIIEEEV